MKRVLILSVIVLISCSQKAWTMSQISLQNNTSFWLYLYIDNTFGCGPVMPSGFCTSSVAPGSHLLAARKGSESGTSITSEIVKIEDGASPTWTVTYIDPDAELIKKLNGTRFVNQRTWPKIGFEYELNIVGNTLIWKARITWAAPEVTLPRPIGAWSEVGRGQIIGREAHIRQQNEDDVFTFSEDGNSITGKEKAGTYTFYRQ